MHVFRLSSGGGRKWEISCHCPRCSSFRHAYSIIYGFIQKEVHITFLLDCSDMFTVFKILDIYIPHNALIARKIAHAFRPRHRRYQLFTCCSIKHREPRLQAGLHATVMICIVGKAHLCHFNFLFAEVYWVACNSLSVLSSLPCLTSLSSTQEEFFT